MSGPTAEFKEHLKVNQIADQDLSPITRKSKIIETKIAFLLEKNSSLKTIFNIANTMVGSSIVVFPNLFQQSGIITSLIVLVVIGIISCKTCLLEIAHFKMSELDFGDTIMRILGRRWYYFYSFVSILLLFFAGIVYFLLIAKMGYSFLIFIFSKTDVDYNPQNEQDFSRFSYQYFGLIVISLSFILFCLKDLKFILKLSQYGLISIVVFAVSVVVKGFLSLISEDFRISNIKLITYDFATISGVLSSAFFLHNLVIPIIKNNREEKNNARDTVIGYILGGSFYGVIGIFGAISISGLPNQAGSQTVLDYYGNNLTSAIIEILLFLQLGSVLPILWYVCRTQFFNLVFKEEKVPRKWFFFTNVVFSLICLGLQIQNVDPSLLISLNGVICCYFMIYTIPIALHLTCLYWNKNKAGESSNNDTIELSATQVKLDKDESPYIEKDEFGDIVLEKDCVSDHENLKKRFRKETRFIIYGIVSMLGLVLAALKIINLLKD